MPGCYLPVACGGNGIVGQSMVTLDKCIGQSMPSTAVHLPKRSISSGQLLTQRGLEHGLNVELCLDNTGRRVANNRASNG